jgi:hypothetical protein
VLLAFFASAGPAFMQHPWNPYIIALPAMWFLVLCVLAVRGLASLRPATVVGSFLVQTHVGTVPMVAALRIAVAAYRRWTSRRHPGAVQPGLTRVGWLWAGLLGLAWVPVIAEQLGGGNLTRIADFFLTAGDGQSPSAAAQAMVSAPRPRQASPTQGA